MFWLFIKKNIDFLGFAGKLYLAENINQLNIRTYEKDISAEKRQAKKKTWLPEKNEHQNRQQSHQEEKTERKEKIVSISTQKCCPKNIA